MRSDSFEDMSSTLISLSINYSLKDSLVGFLSEPLSYMKIHDIIWKLSWIKFEF